MRRLLGGSIFAAAACVAAWAQPSIEHWEPHGLRPGHTNQVAVHGKELDAIEGYWSSFPASFHANEDKDKSRNEVFHFDIRIPDSASPGLHAVRFFNRRGFSDVVLVQLDPLPYRSVTAVSSPTQAKELPWPCAVEARVPDRSAVCYQIRGQPGETVTVEVVANRLGSRLDPHVRLLRTNGTVIREVEDSRGVSPDILLTHTFEQKEEPVILEIRDAIWGGGEDHFFRLRVGQWPAVTHFLPPFAVRGESTKIVPVLPEDKRDALARIVEIPEDWIATTFPVSVGPSETQALANGCALLEVKVVSERFRVETEPNEQADVLELVDAPLLAGSFQSADDMDLWRIDVSSAGKVRFQGYTREFGSEADLYMELYDTEGNRLAVSDPDSGSSQLIDHEFLEPMEARLQLEELTSRSGHNLLYWIRIRHKPLFELQLEQDTWTAEPGAPVELKVKVNRDDWDGEVELEAVSEGGLFAQSRVEREAKETVLKWVVPEDWQPGKVVVFRIRGRADSRADWQYATTGVVWGKRFPLMIHPPLRWRQTLLLGVAKKSSHEVENQ